MDLGIMLFSSSDGPDPNNKYGLVCDVAKFADQHGFTCLWTPERHFHEFGSLFPNPSVTSAALAMITNRIQIRAGSLISPLHDPVRVAEEWAIVDNLSGGRVAISFGSGWNVEDFIFFPERYSHRQELMYSQIEIIRSLWRGESVTRVGGIDKPVVVTIHPRPIQAQLPVWVTSSGDARTYVSAGTIGANLLTHLVTQDLETLESKIRRYREARAVGGFNPMEGKVSLMLHTFLGSDIERVKQIVRAPLQAYLKSAVSLEARAAAGGGTISGGHKIEPHDIPDDAMQDLLEVTFERYFHRAALMGTPETCRNFIGELEAIGVDEIACLVDFGVGRDDLLDSLHYLGQLRVSLSADAETNKSADLIKQFSAALI